MSEPMVGVDDDAEAPAWNQRNPYFPRPCRHELHNNSPGDAVLRFSHAALPLWFQHFLRDSGFLRFAVDSSVTATIALAAPWLGLTRPTLLGRFLSTSQRLVRLKYGEHKHQVVEMYSAPAPAPTAPALVFVHGGAWGSGRPWMYRLLVDTFIELGFGHVFLGML